MHRGIIMSQSNICIRMDENLKKRFDYLCNEFGLTMSTAINMFIKAVVRENRIPFEITLERPNLTTIQAIKDVKNGVVTSVPYTSSQDVIQAILGDNDED